MTQWKNEMLERTYEFNEQTKLVGGWATPLKNMISLVGMMKFSIEQENMATKPTTKYLGF